MGENQSALCVMEAVRLETLRWCSGLPSEEFPQSSCVLGEHVYIFLFLYMRLYVHMCWVFNTDRAPRMKRHGFLLQCR